MRHDGAGLAVQITEVDGCETEISPAALEIEIDHGRDIIVGWYPLMFTGMRDIGESAY